MARIHFFQEGWYEMLGIQYISAILKSQGFETTLSIGYKESFLNRIEDGDIIAFSIMSGMEGWALEVARNIKKRRKVSTIFGGPHPTYFPEIIREDGCDVICRGEGEFAMLEFVQSVDHGTHERSIKNLWFKDGDTITKNPLRELVDNLDEMPFPDRTIYYESDAYFRDTSTKYVIVGRGCPFSCAFCFNDEMKRMYKGLGNYIRWRSPENVLEEIKNLRSYSKVDSIFFMDDTLSLNKRWIQQFLPLYGKEIAIPFLCLVRADTIDEDICALLAGANCRIVGFGVESGDENLRNDILKKRITDEQIYRAASLLKKYGIRFMTFNMLALPGETIEQAFKTVEMNINIGTDYPRSGIFTPYPGTVLGDKVRMEGLVDGRIEANTKHKASIIKNPDRDKFTNLNHLFQFAIRFPSIWPLVKRAVYYPPNTVFKIIWFIMFMYTFTKSELRKGRDVIRFAFKTFFRN